MVVAIRMPGVVFARRDIISAVTAGGAGRTDRKTRRAEFNECGGRAMQARPLYDGSALDIEPVQRRAD
jgi:hypothetical protein